MAHSYTRLIYHVVFGTKGREPWIDQALEVPLHAKISSIVRDLGGMAMKINGVADHVHLLVRLRPDVPVSKIIGDIKSRSTGWVHRNRSDLAMFAWQTGYGAFTVGHHDFGKVESYIDNQKEHHLKEPYDVEIRSFLRLAGIEIDEMGFWE